MSSDNTLIEERTKMGRIKVDGYKCERCGHIWTPRTYTYDEGDPVLCPSCKSAYWNKPKTKGVKK